MFNFVLIDTWMSGIDQHLAKNTAEVSAKGHLKVTLSFE
jgi:hypothetical protein